MIMASNGTLAHPCASHHRSLRTVTLTFLLASCLALPPAATAAGEREMGTGIPLFGQYSQATGTAVIVWSLEEGTVPFPSDCQAIRLSPETMGIDAYKMAVATMLASRISRRPVRFYAHASRDGGCGVDYVQLN
jgi:hypothetical protein